MRRHPSNLHPLRLFVAALLLLSVFVLWLISVVVPITYIEMQYQFRSFVLPKFNIDMKNALSRNTQNGISIPSVFIDEPVIFNVDPNDPGAYLAALKHGIAHASGTAFPGNGGPTSSAGRLGYYFAHSSTPAFVSRYNAVFYLLDKVSVGDRVYIWHEGDRNEYTVYAKQITSPGDVSFLHRTYPADTVVLQTCWPPGTSSGRLLVFASHTK